MSTRSRLVTILASMLFVLALAVPAIGQEPYPPPPPDDGGGPGTVAADVEVTLECGTAVGRLDIEGVGFSAESTVTIQISSPSSGQAMVLATVGLQLAQSRGEVVAAYSEDVDDDGEFTSSYTLPDDYSDPVVRVVTSGQDQDGDAVSFSEVVQLRGSQGCQGQNASDQVDSGGGGQGPVQGAPDAGGGGVLAFTGVNVLVLLLVALALIGGGLLVLRQRRGRGDAAA